MKYSFLLIMPILWVSNMDVSFAITKLRLLDTIPPEYAQKRSDIMADSMLIDSLSDRIYHLKRVQKLNGVHSISILLPQTSDESYNFNVGYNLDERFQTIFIFIYKKQDKKLYFYDVSENKLIEVSKWNK